MPYIKSISIHADVKSSIAYILNPEKTEDTFYTASLNCLTNAEEAYLNMKMVYEHYSCRKYNEPPPLTGKLFFTFPCFKIRIVLNFILPIEKISHRSNNGAAVRFPFLFVKTMENIPHGLVPVFQKIESDTKRSYIFHNNRPLLFIPHFQKCHFLKAFCGGT